MTKLQRNSLWIFISFAIICFALAKILEGVDDGKPKPIEYPASNLSQDLFVSQNTEYVVNEALADSYSFTDVPYMIDLVTGERADVDGGHLVRVSNDTVIFVSEYPKDEDFNEVILNQYPPVIYLNYAKDTSYTQTVASDSGYFNGYYANYFVNHMLISQGPSVTAQSAYMVGYNITLGSEYDKNLIVSIATTTDTTENLETCKMYVDAFMYTLRYDEELARQIENRKEAELREAERQALLEENNSVSAGNQNAVTQTSSDSIEITVPKDFTSLQLLVSWSNNMSSVDMDVVDINGNSIVMKKDTLNKLAIIDVGICSAGTYYINCPQMGMLGNINVKMVEGGNN